MFLRDKESRRIQSDREKGREEKRVEESFVKFRVFASYLSEGENVSPCDCIFLQADGGDEIHSSTFICSPFFNCFQSG